MTLFHCVRVLSKPSYAGRVSFRIEQCRALYLMREVFSKGNAPPGGSKITQLVPFDKFEDPKDYIIDLYNGAGKAHHNHRRMTLLSAMNLNINPGWALCRKDTSEDNEVPQCRMKLLMSEKLQTHALGRTGKGYMRSRIFRFSSKTSLHTFIEMMAIMWNHLSKRQAVEIQVQYHRRDFAAELKNGTADPFKVLFAKNVHFRPDVILKAMPEKCGIIVGPQTDQKGVVAWIIGPPHIDRDGEVVAPISQIRKLDKRRKLALERAAETMSHIAVLAGLTPGDSEPILEQNQPADRPREFSDSKQRMIAKMKERQEARRVLEKQLKEREAQRERERSTNYKKLSG